MIRDIIDHSLPWLELEGHEALTDQFRTALAGPKPPCTPQDRALRETEEGLARGLQLEDPA